MIHASTLVLWFQEQGQDGPGTVAASRLVRCTAVMSFPHQRVGRDHPGRSGKILPDEAFTEMRLSYCLGSRRWWATSCPGVLTVLEGGGGVGLTLHETEDGEIP